MDSAGAAATSTAASLIAAALALAGHRPVAASGVSDASRRRAEELLPGVPLVTPDEVLAKVHERSGAVNNSTVYRTLELLE